MYAAVFDYTEPRHYSKSESLIVPMCNRRKRVPLFLCRAVTVMLVTYVGVMIMQTLTYGHIKNMPKSRFQQAPQSLEILDTTPGESAAVVPRLVHLAWFGGKRPVFRYHHVISVMSSLRFIQPKQIMFWHDLVPTGKWWRFIQQKINESTTTLVMMRRDAPTKIFGNRIFYPEHQSDVVRLEALMAYGGIYHDLDVVILRPLDPLYRYEMTMGEELPDWLCNGFMMSVANSTFLRRWYDEYRTFQWSRWNYHSVILPGILAKKYPNGIHIEKNSIHKPNWEHVNQLYYPGVLYNWKSQNYAIHLWYRKYNMDHTPDTIKQLNTTMGHIFRYIFYGKSDMI